MQWQTNIGKPLSSLSSILFSLADFIAPVYCEVCRTYLDHDNNHHKFICDKCFDSLPLAPGPDVIFNKLVSNFDKDDLAISNAICLFSVAEDHDYMNLIYSLKYVGFSKIGLEFGKALARLMQMNDFTKYDFIVPVPIHHARYRERGYNQSQLIAEGVGSILSIPVLSKIIKRRKYTQTQTVLSKEKRRTNVSKAIVPYSEELDLSGKFILLVDDVLTTGSTLNSCASVLLNMGTKKVDVAAIVNA